MLKIVENIYSLKENRIFIFVLFAFSLFFKCAFFNYSITGHYLLGSIIKNPIYFLFFYSSCIGVSFFIASFLVIIKKKYWIIIVSLLLDLLFMSNIIYYRANDLLINGHAILMTNNMSGFWNSVIVYFRYIDLIFLSLTVCLSCFLFCFNDKSKFSMSWKTWMLLLLLSFSFFMVKAVHTMKWNNWNVRSVSNIYKYDSLKDFNNYITYYDPIHYFFMASCQSFSLLSHQTQNRIVVMNMDDERRIKQRLCINKATPKVQNDSLSHLYVILVESLESWVINNQYTPNIVRFMDDNKNHLLYANKVRHQTKRGTSMDAQLLVNTGILPTKEDIVCNFYYNNYFFSLADIYKQSGNRTQMLVPHDKKIWNQNYMSKAFHFDSLASFDHYGNDRELFSELIHYVSDKSNKYVQTITISSHVPFEHEKKEYILELPDNIEKNSNIPTSMKLYLKSVHYMDSQLGNFLNSIDYSNSILLIAGDHTWESYLTENCTEQTRSLLHKEDCIYIPVIIYAPQIKKNIQIQETVYQMDIYPTILSLLNRTNYVWQGFGVDLSDSIAIRNRTYTEEDAYDLSDKIIRSDYFRYVKDSLLIESK
ncbi:MAG TPA: LTA synthase family protein [Paludibacteraceae bacterium]|nr:LTA synthase family protein [Paludibacteraceae bacterium]HQJ89051.1 LTA synthase family protein [Paludibacteraceae bacterium]